jgi:hypothetical protein
MRRYRNERRISIKKVNPLQRKFHESFNFLYNIGNMFDVFEHYYPGESENDKRFYERRMQLKRDRISVEKEIKRQEMLNIPI